MSCKFANKTKIIKIKHILMSGVQSQPNIFLYLVLATLTTSVKTEDVNNKLWI